MNLAVIQGGEKVRRLWSLLHRHSHPENYPRLVAVVDPDPLSWKEESVHEDLLVTSDVGDLSGRDIDLVVDLRNGKGAGGNSDERGPGGSWLCGSNAQLFLEMLLGFALFEQAKHELEELRIRYSAAINAFLQEDVLLISRDYDIIDINEAMLHKLGLTREEVMGRHCYEISHGRRDPCDGSDHPCPLKSCLEKKNHSQATHIHKDKKGRELYFSISCYPVFENEEVVGAVEISKDITRDILLEKNLFHQEKMASIGQLAAGVAHEINNPLTTILTTAMLIQEDMKEDEPNYEELRTIVNETLRCRKIVTSLLTFARQSRPTKAPQDVNDIVRETVALTRKQAAFKDVEFEINLSGDLPSALLDKDQIQQSFINLALNAIEASGPGGKIRFTTLALPDKKSVEVTVSDTGTGIPESELDHVFDPFFTTKDSGTGLGLAITHGIIQRHGGSIEVESREGQGTTFRIRLPVARGDDNGR
jgi:PAS domain S-box-containing protein